MSLAERFWVKVDIGSADECWEWTACVQADGYGWFSLRKGTPIPASRMAWILTHGEISDPTLCVLHRCDNRPCCNPEHLFLGTRGDNARDAQRKHVPRRGSRSGIRGVIWDNARQRWSARVHIDGHTHYLGRFESKDDAATIARDFRNEHLR